MKCLKRFSSQKLERLGHKFQRRQLRREILSTEWWQSEDNKQCIREEGKHGPVELNLSRGHHLEEPSKWAAGCSGLGWVALHCLLFILSSLIACQFIFIMVKGSSAEPGIVGNRLWFPDPSFWQRSVRHELANVTVASKTNSRTQILAAKRITCLQTCSTTRLMLVQILSCPWVRGRKGMKREEDGGWVMSL